MAHTAELWLDSEEPVERFPPPPVNTRAQVLPLASLTWENFERLCYRLAWRHGEVSYCHRYGTQGQDQQGIDLYVLRRPSDERYTTWQCKRYKKFSTSKLQTTIDEFLREEWAAKTSVFHLAVSDSLSDLKFVRAIEKARRECSTRSIEFVPLDEDKLSELLKAHPDLVDDFFDRPWVKEFCGNEAAACLSRRKLTREQRIQARQRLGNLYATHFATVDVGLPTAAVALRNAAPQLPLHQRYVVPSVEAVSLAIEAPNPSNREPPQSGGGEAERSQRQADSANAPSGFRVREHRTTLNLFDWFSTVHNGVVLGGPGLGKSAAMRFLALDLLSKQPRNETLARKWGSYLPLFLPFAMLARLVREREITSMSDFLRGWLQKLSATEETITLMENALDDERLLLILDGLDEWTDVTAATTALTVILDFAGPRGLPVVASARRLGFERLGGLGSQWKQADLLPLHEEQQREFTKIWFQHFHSAAATTSDPPQLAAIVQRDTDGFIEQIQHDSALANLAGIPLLLSALIYLRLRGQLLPRSRYATLEEFTKSLIAEQPHRRAQAALQGSGLPRQHARLTERGIEFLALTIHEKPDSDGIAVADARQALAEFYQTAEFRKAPSEAVELADEQIERATHEVGILVRRDQEDSIGFLHRSLQEFLAAKQLQRHSLVALQEVFRTNSGEPVWQEVLLSVLYLLKRNDEVDALLNLVGHEQTNPLGLPLRQIFLARAVFGDLNCSAGAAEKIAAEIFSLVETSTWWPLRHTLLQEIVQGLDSDVVGGMVCRKLKSWFPGYHEYRFGLCGPLASKPGPRTGERLFVALFNTNRDGKEIAEAIGAGAPAWPELAERLHALLLMPADQVLLSFALHALALGWPGHPNLANLLVQFSQSKASYVRIVALIHRAKRGDTPPEVRDALAAFCRASERIYGQEKDVIEALSACWPRDQELRNTALRAAHGYGGPAEWDRRVAIKFLIRAWPGDDEVAKVIAENIKPEDESRRGIRFDWEDWPVLLPGFAGHPLLVPATEAWLDAQKTTHLIHEIGQIAMLGRSKHCTDFLIAGLRTGRLHGGWPVKALIQIVGPSDEEFRKVVTPLLEDPKKAADLARHFPQLIDNRAECEERLLAILKNGKGTEITSALDGLELMNRLNSEQTLRIAEERLKADENGGFWWASRSHLVTAFPQHPIVREKALQDIESDDAPLSELVAAYVTDPEVRERLEKLLEPLHEGLRFDIAKSVEPFAKRGNTEAKQLLSTYRYEPDAQVRTAAAAGYYAAVARYEDDLCPHVAHLLTETSATGPLFDVRVHSAVAGLIALKRFDELSNVLPKEGNNRLVIYSNAGGDRNWELIRLLIENWQQIDRIYGPEAWGLLGDWDILVTEMARAGKRSLVLKVPSNLRDQARKNIHQDEDGFRAFAVWEEGQHTFRDLCVSFFAKLVSVPGQHSTGWGYNEVQVMLAAGYYLADHHAGDAELGRRLEEIAVASHEPGGPVIALCRGWPNAGALQKMWDQAKDEAQWNASPVAAWLVGLKASAAQFVEYVMSLPRQMQRDRIWSFPAETIRAIRDRLQRDSESRQLLLAAIKTSSDNDFIGSGARLLGATMPQRKNLAAWVSEKLASLKHPADIAALGYDIMAGTYRPLEHCLIESCLTR